jgi:putative transposase
MSLLAKQYPLPKPYSTDVLTDEQIMFIAQQLPSPKATTGRPAYSNQELLPGILRVLRSGCRWRDLNLPGYPDGSTHWRRLRFWRKGLHFRWLWSRILKLLQEQNPQARDESIKRLSIDGTLLPSFAFKERSGYSGKHRRVGVKASIVVDATGLPLSVVIARGNAHDVALAENTVSHIRGHAYIGATMLADRGYDSRKFRRFAFYNGIKPNIPKRSYTKEGKDPYRSHMYRYDKEIAKNRFIVERTNAWLKGFRRLRCRFDYQTASFEAFLYLAIIIICVRRLVVAAHNYPGAGPQTRTGIVSKPVQKLVGKLTLFQGISQVLRHPKTT